MNAPRYAVYMMLDEPHATAATHGYATAGWVAAPAAGRVIARIGPMLGMLPDLAPRARRSSRRCTFRCSRAGRPALPRTPVAAVPRRATGTPPAHGAPGPRQQAAGPGAARPTRRWPGQRRTTAGTKRRPLPPPRSRCLRLRLADMMRQVPDLARSTIPPAAWRAGWRRWMSPASPPTAGRWLRAICSPRSPAAARDGRAFIAEAVARGAAAVLAPEGTDWPPGVPPRPLIEDPEPRRRLAQLAGGDWPGRSRASWSRSPAPTARPARSSSCARSGR